jgi:branched-subunit amino acid ABC-type transport system permease component
MGVLNVINLLHGSLIVLGAYLAYWAFSSLGLHPFLALPLVALILFALGYLLQRYVINPVMAAPVLITLVLTFGLDLLLYNALIVGFSATPRRILLDLGQVRFGDVILPIDRIAAMLLVFLLTGLLYLVMRASWLGRAIVAVRMDREAALLMGIRARNVYAMTFGIGALMAGAAGCLVAVVFHSHPASPKLCWKSPSWYVCSAVSAPCQVRSRADSSWGWVRASWASGSGRRMPTLSSSSECCLFLFCDRADWLDAPDLNNGAI